MREELSPAIENYLRFRASQDYSKGTLRVDGQVLKRFLAANGNIWCHAITDRHVSRHFEEASKSRSSSTLGNDHGVLSGFFKWARHTGRMPTDSNPMFGRRRAKATKRERNRIPVYDFPRLLDAAGERDLRDRALLAVLLYTLMRDSEATDLRVRDVDLQGGWLSARIYKTRREDRMPIPVELDRELRPWLTHYTQVVGPLQPHYFLIPARTQSPVNGANGKITHHLAGYRPEKRLGNTSRILKPSLEAIGFPVVDQNGKPCGEGAHTIRRSGARALFDTLVASGYDHALRIVQSMLHHASMTETEKYIGITADRRSRDDVLRGKHMYPSSSAGVVSIAR